MDGSFGRCAKATLETTTEKFQPIFDSCMAYVKRIFCGGRRLRMRNPTVHNQVDGYCQFRDQFQISRLPKHPPQNFLMGTKMIWHSLLE